MGLISYLRSARQAISTLSSSKEKVHVVIGNEACDLDSAVCALVTAYYLAKKQRRLVVPILNIPREDYALRTEVRHVFGLAGIHPNLLNFHCDVNLVNLHRQKRLTVTLVDHNTMSWRIQGLASSVVQIIDHHHMNVEPPANIDRLVEPVASCSTLVAEILLTNQPALVDPVVARLLLAAIVVDTCYFLQSLKRTTFKDLDVFHKLSKVGPNVCWAAEHVAIKRAKESVEDMSVYDILRKDLKCVRSNDGNLLVAIPTVPTTQQVLCTMPNFVEHLELFRNQCEADAVVILTAKSFNSKTASESEYVKCGLILYTIDSKLERNLLNYLLHFDKPSLELIEDLTTHSLINAGRPLASPIHIMEQRNVAVSRKIVLPAIKLFVDAFSHSSF